MEHIVVDRSGTLKDGYFYELDVQVDDDVKWRHSKTPELDIVSLRQPTDEKLAVALRRERKEGSYVSVAIEQSVLPMSVPIVVEVR